MKSVLKPKVGLEIAMTRASYIKLSWWKVCLGLWILSMIPTPLFPDHFLAFSYLSTILLSIAILGYALEKYGLKAYLLFIVSFGFGVAVEWLGKTTGFPFGSYSYTALGPTILGVPLIVPLGWWAFSIIALSVPSYQKYWLAPLALVAWDVGLDPLMVKQGFWVFAPEGIYFGVPLSNFLGWYGAGFILMQLLVWLEPRMARGHSPILRFTFGVQAFFIGVGLTVFYAMPVAGFIAMSVMGCFLFITNSSSELLSWHKSEVEGEKGRGDKETRRKS